LSRIYVVSEHDTHFVLRVRTNTFHLCFIESYMRLLSHRGRRGRNRIVVGSMTTYICNQCLSPL